MAQAQKVLIAEDSERQSAELVRLLQNLGYSDVNAAATAHDAIRHAVQDRPSVVFLDGLLPGMHGFEVARFIRGIDAKYRPRIIITTAIYKNVRYQNEAKLKYGVDAYLVKPITADALRQAMSEAMAA